MSETIQRPVAAAVLPHPEPVPTHVPPASSHPGESMAWYVTSDPDHPVNAGRPHVPMLPASMHAEMKIDLDAARNEVSRLEAENASLRSQLPGHGSEFRMPPNAPVQGQPGAEQMQGPFGTSPPVGTQRLTDGRREVFTAQGWMSLTPQNPPHPIVPPT